VVGYSYPTVLKNRLWGNRVGGTTKIDCENTGGYNVRPGIHAYEYCPFCGHPVIEGEDHELTLSIEG
jgi:hypothetical protein